MNLTKAQRAVLERLAKGDELWTTMSHRQSAFWHGSFRDRSPRIDSVLILERSGHIERRRGDERVWKYRITEAGRRALEGGDG